MEPSFQSIHIKLLCCTQNEVSTEVRSAQSGNALKSRFKAMVFSTTFQFHDMAFYSFQESYHLLLSFAYKYLIVGSVKMPLFWGLCMHLYVFSVAIYMRNLCSLSFGVACLQLLHLQMLIGVVPLFA